MGASRSRSTGGAPPPWAVASSSARGGALHPDLRFRLRELGIAISSDLLRAPPVRGPPTMLACPAAGPAEDNHSKSTSEAVVDDTRPPVAVSSSVSSVAPGDAVSSPACGSRSPAPSSCSPTSGSRSPGSDKIRLSKPDKSRTTGSGDTSGLKDPGLDDLLLQLDDLDARNRALQQDAASRTLQHKCVKETMASTAAAAAFAAAASSAKVSRSPKAAKSSVEKTMQSEEAAAAESVARQHPLAGVQLYGSTGPDGGARAIEQLRWRRRRDRPPKALLSVAAPDAAASPSASVQGGSSPTVRHYGGEAAWQSHRRGKQAVGGSVALPPLKSSASAPGCLLAATSWTHS